MFYQFIFWSKSLKIPLLFADAEAANYATAKHKDDEDGGSLQRETFSLTFYFSSIASKGYPKMIGVKSSKRRYCKNKLPNKNYSLFEASNGFHN